MYFLVGTITNNITKTSLREFAKNLNEDDYDASIDMKDYISKLVNEGRLKISVLNNYLFEELFFGQHKDVYIHEIYNFNNDILFKKNLDKIINDNYDGNSEFNRIAETLLSNENERLELVACKTKTNIENEEINNIKLLFAYRIKRINDKGSIIEEHSYIPIEVDLKRNLLISKVVPKTKLYKDNYKPEVLYERYTEKVMKMFDIEINSYYNNNKIALYNMSEGLYKQIYNKMMLKKSDNLGQIIECFCDEIIKELNIEKISEKKKTNNIFDIKYSINKYFDQLLITDILKNRKFGIDAMEDIDGLVTYIRFNDGSNVSAKVSGENYRASIYTSETYMALRDPIENANKISEIKVIWILKDKDLRIKYNTKSCEYLYMHFYKNFSEEDFKYGYKKYKEYESISISKVDRMAR